MYDAYLTEKLYDIALPRPFAKDSAMRPVVKEGRSSYILPFRDPITGKSRTPSLKTTEEHVAVAIMTDIEALCKADDILQAPRDQLDKLRTYERRAVEIIFGDDIAREAFGTGTGAALEHADINAIIGTFEDSEALSKKSKRDEGIEWTEGERHDWVYQELAALTPAGFRRIKESFAKAITELEDLRIKNHYLQTELIKLRKDANFAITVTIAKAIRGPAANPEGLNGAMKVCKVLKPSSKSTIQSGIFGSSATGFGNLRSGCRQKARPESRMLTQSTSINGWRRSEN